MLHGRRLALIIASSEFKDPTLQRLITPGNDAVEFARVLQDPGIGGFEVKTLINRTSSESQIEIEDFFTDRKKDDMVLLYFSGHGIKDDDGHLYLATTDTRRKRLRSSTIPATYIHDNMLASRSRQQILILDCCYSGAFASGMVPKGGDSVDLKERFEGRGRVVLTSSNSTQYAFQGDEVIGEGQKSIFTHYLVKGLKTGEADRNNDGWVSLDELYDYVFEGVVGRSHQQTPKRWSDLQGNIQIAYNPRNDRNVAVKNAQIATLYDSGVAAWTVGQWQEALRLFEQLEALSPGYLDTAQKITHLKRVVFALEQSDLMAEKKQPARQPVDIKKKNKSSTHKYPYIIGIDFGTTKSAVSFIDESGTPVIIPSIENENFTPSVFAMDKDKNRLVGRTAKKQAIINPNRTISSVKRLLGRKFADPEIQRFAKRLPYQLDKTVNGDISIKLENQVYSPQEVCAMILAKLKNDAEVYLGEQVTQAVITVPASFNEIQRNALKDAGKIAGLEVLRIINETTASSIAYGLDKKKNEIIAVYDLGGGTFDVSILDVGDGVFQVRATSGDTFLGGDDFDLRVMDYLIEQFVKDSGIDPHNDRQALQRLKEASEKAKIELSTTMQTEINLPYLIADATGPKHLVMTMTRAKLEQITADLVDRTIAPLKQALSDAGFTAGDINEVVMVGGMTRMPAVQDRVRAFFGKEPYKGVNPDEVVAIGAAVQGGVLSGEVKDIMLLDVTSLSLSIETLGGVATPQIERNTTIPTRRTQVFSTASDNQTQVEIHVLQGERPMAADNKSLGKFILDGIPPAPRGVPQIEVTFDIDANGMLKVTAIDKATKRSQTIRMSSASRLSDLEVEQLRRKIHMLNL